MITGTALLDRNCLHTSVPLIPGSITSSRTMSAPLRSVDGDLRAESFFAQQKGEGFSHRLLVLDDQNLGHETPRWTMAGVEGDELGVDDSSVT